MCGIAGFSGRFDPALLSRMNRLLAHRGPDDSGEWLDQQAGVGLANRRLAIIDLSPEGHQPMSNSDESVFLAYNGEVYNFRELPQEFLGKGHQFRSRTDTEVLIHLYEEEGLQMLSRLNGIFALAPWDSAHEQLLLARDGIRVKPFTMQQPTTE